MDTAQISLTRPDSLEIVFPRELTETEGILIDRGVVQITALVAARITGKGLMINPGSSEFAWSFVLVGATEDEEKEFAEHLPQVVEGYVKAGFPDARFNWNFREYRLD